MKKGISLVSLAVVIIVMIILASVVIVSGIDIFQSTTMNMFVVEMINIQSNVNEYYYRYDTYPVGEEVTIDVSGMDTNSLSQFNGENITDNKITVKKVDLSLVGINEIEFGNDETDKDIYVLSETTGTVYYLAGIEYNSKVYYKPTQDLLRSVDISNLPDNINLSSKDIKKYDVIFTVSQTSYTNKPITVKVKIPQAATLDSVTVTNSKSISEIEVINGYNVVAINETSENRNGNYDIEVIYTYNGVQKTAKHSITNFDNTAPELTTVFDREGIKKVIIVSAADNESGIKYIKYETGEITDYTYFTNHGKALSGSEIKLDINSVCTIYVQDNAGNYNIVTEKSGITTVPDTWKKNVSAITSEGIPIPKGFVASPYEGENTKNGGLVIYELDAGKTEITPGETQFESWTERNQYVWVPVDDFVNQFRRQNFGKTSVSIVEADVGVDGYWEVILDSTNMPDVAKNMSKSAYMTVTTPENGITNTLSEVQAMYASVKEYGGFYIARYEAGLDIDDRKKSDDGVIIKDIHSKMNKAPYNNVRWTKNNEMGQDTNGAVEVARSLYPVNSTSNTTGVVSTLIYGVQWDRTLAWYIETKAMTLNEVSSDSTDYGNYLNHDIASYIELNADAQFSRDEGENYNPVTEGYSKGSETTDESHLLTTGALKVAKVNNIYDIAGNVQEWTMEGIYSHARVPRGGRLWDDGNQATVFWGIDYYPNDAAKDLGFRPALYIKMD